MPEPLLANELLSVVARLADELVECHVEVQIVLSIVILLFMDF